VAVALLLAATLGGLGLTFVVPLPLPPLPRVAGGFCAGSVLLGLAALVLACAFGLGPGTIAASAAVALLPGLALLRPAPRARAAEAWAGARAGARALAGRPLAALLLATYALAMAGVLWRVFERSAFVDEGGLQTADAHNFGDLPFHLGVIAGFVQGQNFPPEHPELAGARLTYPFLADLVSALLVRAGATPVGAIVAHDWLLGLALVVLLHHMARRWTSDGAAALIAPLLVLFSGGAGYLLLARDAQASGATPWELLRALPADYTMRDEAALRWGNALTTLLVTQRSFLMGLPLFVLVAALWWDAVHQQDPRAARHTLGAAGVVTGLLPLVHGHSFAAAMAIACALALLFPRREWKAFFAASVLLAIPQVAWIARGSAMQAGSFLGVQIGWDRGGTDPFSFWLRNTGVFIPLLAAALALRRRLLPPLLARFYLPFAACFVLPNLLRLSPWIWDNIKFLFLWWTASAPLVAAVLARLLRGRPLARAAGAVLLLAAVLAGALDVWRVAQPVRSHVVFSPAALATAEQLAALTPPRALVLHAPTHDSPVLLTGRRSLLGYEGHIWSQGLAKGRRAEMIRHVYEGRPAAAELLGEMGADFIFVGGQERAAYAVDESFLGRFPLVADGGSYRLYRVR
jgi:hypothetical protein